MADAPSRVSIKIVATQFEVWGPEAERKGNVSAHAHKGKKSWKRRTTHTHTQEYDGGTNNENSGGKTLVAFHDKKKTKKR